MASKRPPRKSSSRGVPYRKKGISPAFLVSFGIFVGAWLFWLYQERPALFFPGQLSSRRSILPSAGNDTPLPIAPIVGTSAGVRDRNYRSIDEPARSLDYRGDSVSELAGLLSRYAVTPADKARAIYVWLTHHIAYDVAGFLKGNYGDISPRGVLRSRSTICSGYANLYQALAKEMGLEAAVIEGYARGTNYLVGSPSAINHAWNAVKIDNAWYLVDATWGAGTVNGDSFQANFNPYYFATPPEQIIYSHFPARSVWQLLPVAYTKEQFDSFPNLSPNFFTNGLQLVSHRDHTIQTNGTLEVLLRVPADTLVSARLQQNSMPLNDNFLFVQQKNGEASLKVTFPGPGTYELEVFSKRRSDETLLQRSLAYRVIATAGGPTFPKTFASFSDNNVYLYNPTTGQLPVGQLVPFQVEVPNAVEVVVIDAASEKWTPLTRSGAVFVGSVPIGSGKVTLAAKFPGSDRYMTLAEYN